MTSRTRERIRFALARAQAERARLESRYLPRPWRPRWSFAIDRQLVREEALAAQLRKGRAA